MIHHIIWFDDSISFGSTLCYNWLQNNSSVWVIVKLFEWNFFDILFVISNVNYIHLNIQVMQEHYFQIEIQINEKPKAMNIHLLNQFGAEDKL